MTFVKPQIEQKSKQTLFNSWEAPGWGYDIRSRHWPLWYTWIRITPYLQVNGPPWAPPSNSVDHSCLCQHSSIVDRSNLDKTITPSRCSPW